MDGAILTRILFSIYAVSGYLCFCAILVVYNWNNGGGYFLSLKSIHPGLLDQYWWLRTLQTLAVLSLLILSFGTACDNARIVAGTFPSNFGNGLFDLDGDETLANETILNNNTGPAALRYFTWFCFCLHEVFGSIYALPALYTVVLYMFRHQANDTAVAATIPEGKIKSYGYLLGAACFGIVASFILGLVTYIYYPCAQEGQCNLQLRYNDGLEKWSYEPHPKNPFGLFGVFFATFLIVAASFILWYHHSIRWFVIVQVLLFVGQGAAVSLKDYMSCFSNALEQVLAWSLLLVWIHGTKQHSLEINNDYTSLPDCDLGE